MINWPEEKLPEEGPPFYIERNGKVDGPFKNNQEARVALNLKKSNLTGLDMLKVT
jgi:hypothetical protein